MFFRLINSPAMFQTMNNILRDLIKERKAIVYLDDILIFTEDFEGHRQLVRRVLQVLQDNQMSLKLEKCDLEKTKIEYLGVILL
jgi:hypothetical protein